MFVMSAPYIFRIFGLIGLVALVGCATGYQPQSFTGGYSEFLTAPDEAVITFHGNGYTSGERVVEMTGLRCAEVTLSHGYRYFVVTNATDMSRQSSFTTSGYAHTYGTATAFGNFATGSATTTITPPQTFNIYKPAVMASIRMSNDEKALEPLGMVINGQKARPKDAAFLRASLRQALGLGNG
jgi:hypothetical protein